MDVCLIALAAGISRFPLVLAANRDEDHDRPTLPAAFWGEAPDVLGGRDALHLGSWLAISRRGRFAAVTNLHGSLRHPDKRSRGELVSDFVRGDGEPEQYLNDVASRAGQYAGFHLIAGQTGGEIVLCSRSVTVLEPGIHALSNAPSGEHWPKVDIARQEMKELLRIDDAAELAAAVLQFLQRQRGTGHVESEIFIPGEGYGTRSSTAIVVDGDHVNFFEQSYAPGGIRDGPPREFRFAWIP